ALPISMFGSAVARAPGWSPWRRVRGHHPITDTGWVSRQPQAAVSIVELTDDPHPVWARLRWHAEVVWVDELDGWVTLTRAAGARVMRDVRTFTVDDPRFSTGQIVGASMLSTDGATHTAHRRPWADVFKPVAVRNRFTRTLREEVVHLLDRLAAVPRRACPGSPRIASPADQHRRARPGQGRPRVAGPGDPGVAAAGARRHPRGPLRHHRRRTRRRPDPGGRPGHRLPVG